MYEVADFDFDDLTIEFNGVHCGCFGGSAGVDSDGAVCSIALSGQREGNKAIARMDVPNRYKHGKSFIDLFALVVADALQIQFKDTIREKLDDWADSLNTREFEAAE